MSAVTFEPTPDAQIACAGTWYDKLIDITEGGIITLDFCDDGGRASNAPACALYTDSFGEKYEIVQFSSGLLVGDVRED